MSDHNEETQLNTDELAQVRSLIGDADSGDFLLDDILEEYSSSPAPGGDRTTDAADVDLPWPEPPRTRTAADADNVVAFPGTCPDDGDED